MNILITGGTSGLGEAIVKRLASNQSDHIYFTFAHSAEKAETLCAHFPNVSSIHCDFTDPVSMVDLVKKISSLGLGIIINNAVTSLHKEHFHKASPSDFEQSFRENILPVMQITQECISIFRKNKYGKIINILSSAIVNKPPVGWSEYAANKSYLLSMSKSWAIENIRFNITSNSISPSFMQTPLTKDIDERLLEGMINSHPLKKLLTPEEVAESVAFLTTCTQHINGINLLINAGADVI